MSTELRSSFAIDERAGGVRLTQAESFRGALVPLVGRSLRTDTLPASTP